MMTRKRQREINQRLAEEKRMLLSDIVALNR
jgi:transposase